MKKPRKSTRAQKAKIWRLALIGAGVFGTLGFGLGVALCLIYHLPIPPLFLTEIGGLSGGCLGALIGCYSTAAPRRATPLSSETGYENTELY
jgi:hypothetical protein